MVEMTDLAQPCVRCREPFERVAFDAHSSPGSPAKTYAKTHAAGQSATAA